MCPFQKIMRNGSGDHALFTLRRNIRNRNATAETSQNQEPKTSRIANDSKHNIHNRRLASFLGRISSSSHHQEAAITALAFTTAWTGDRAYRTILTCAAALISKFPTRTLLACLEVLCKATSITWITSTTAWGRYFALRALAAVCTAFLCKTACLTWFTHSAA